jgi:hypothetical protein
MQWHFPHPLTHIYSYSSACTDAQVHARKSLSSTEVPPQPMAAASVKVLLQVRALEAGLGRILIKQNKTGVEMLL